MNAVVWRKPGDRRRAVDAKSHGRPVGKPLRHPILGERSREKLAITVCVSLSRMALTPQGVGAARRRFMLSGPRRAQAGSHLPTASARDQRSGSASELTGPRGDVASHFVGRLVFDAW